MELLPNKSLCNKLLPNNLLPNKLFPNKLFPKKLLPNKLLPNKLLPNKLLPNKVIDNVAFAILRIVSDSLLTTFRDYVPGPSSRVKQYKKMGLMSCPETTPRNYHSAPRRIRKRSRLPFTPRPKPEIARGNSSCGFVFRCAVRTGICRPHCDAACPEYADS